MDRRRIKGPEISVPPFYENQNLIKEPQNKRENQREFDRLRNVFIEINLIPQAKGSCFIESGDTRLICSVYGPKQNKKQVFSEKAVLNCEFSLSTFSSEKRGQHQQTNEEKEFSRIMEQALIPSICLDKYPKSIIEVFVCVLQNGGTTSCLANAITAASIALSLAEIELVDITIGCSSVFIKDELRIDPDFNEDDVLKEADHVSRMMVAYMPNMKLVTYTSHIGCPSDLHLLRLGLNKCIEGCYSTFNLVQDVLLKSIA